MGPRVAAEARGRCARALIHPSAVRAGQDARRALERGSEADGASGQDARLHEDVLGEEDPRMDPKRDRGDTSGCLFVCICTPLRDDRATSTQSI